MPEPRPRCRCTAPLCTATHAPPTPHICCSDVESYELGGQGQSGVLMYLMARPPGARAPTPEAVEAAEAGKQQGAVPMGEAAAAAAAGEQ